MDKKSLKNHSLTDGKKQMRLYLFLAFAVPVFTVLVSYIKMGFSPFGDNSLLGMDLWAQYFPMLRHQYETRRQLCLDLFTWDGALGVDSFVQNAYYCNSPFNLLLLLSPLKYLVDAVDYLILFKFGLAGLSFAVYSSYKYKKCDIFTSAAASAYALCSYCLAYINQTMWFDAVIFFPIILLGFERLMKEKKPLLYFIMLAVTIYSSFYISFSICIFLVLYFFVYCAENYGELKVKGIFYGGFRFAIFSLLAGGVAAFVILPVYFGLGNTIASEIPAPTKAELYNTFFEYLSKTFPLTKVSLQFDVPNIYSGCFILFMIPLFIINKKIPLAKKISYSVLTVLLYFSMNLNFLDYAWHGFHFPNQLPGRWTFIFSFVLIVMCCEVLRNLDGVKLPEFIFSFSLSALAVILVMLKVKENPVTTKSLVYCCLFLVAYALIFFMLVNREKYKFGNVLNILLAVCIMVEMFANAVPVLYDTEVGSVKSYNGYNEDIAEFKRNYAEKDDEFCRSEIYYNWTFDHCQLFGLKGITYYSSTMNGNGYNFFKDLGYRVYAKNVSTVYSPYSPVLNSVFNIKYVADIAMQYKPDYLDSVGSGEDVIYLENSKVLPLMFASSRDILKWVPAGVKSNYESQNDFFSALTGENTQVYKKIERDERRGENLGFSTSKIWTEEAYVRTDRTKGIVVNYKYTVGEDGSFYLCHNYKKGDMDITVNGNKISMILYREPIKYIGNLIKGDVIEISVKVDDVNVGTCALDIYKFDNEEFEKYYDILNSKGCTSQKETSNGVICTVNNSEDELMFTSVPLNGMSCYIDGVKTEIKPVYNYLAAVDVPEGEHTVEFKYEVKGLKPGLIISAACVLVAVLITLIPFIKKKKEKSDGITKNTAPVRDSE